MLIVNALILAVVQALTEFWPISSSGHLIILHDLLNFQLIDSLTFDVALHVGTCLALILFFRKEIFRYFRAFIAMFRGFNLGRDDQKTVLNIIIATIPAFLVGYLAEDLIEKYLRNLSVVAIALLLGGLIMIVVERYSQKKLTYEGLSLPEAFVIGCAQALALIPGVSRSGATIITGMALKLKRLEAARFSFLMNIPAVLGAGIKKFFDLAWSNISFQEKYIFAFGIFVSFVVGYFVIKYFLRFLEKKSLLVFAYYRIVIALIILAYLFI